MTTDKETAATYRQIAGLYESIGKDAHARVSRSCADHLDPKPTYADGIYELTQGELPESVLYIRRVDGRWVDSIGQPSDPSPVWKPRRLRVLADDEIAVKRVRHAGPKALRLRVKTNRERLQVSLSTNDENVLLAVADARDAEAGDAK